MKPQQAIDVINQILLKVNMSGQEHAIARQAMEVLAGLVHELGLNEPE